jgi:hypothetical protein
MDEYEKYGDAAYTAYCDTRNWRAFNGDHLPVWANVEGGIKIGWRASARAVIELYDQNRTQDFPQQLAPDSDKAAADKIVFSATSPDPTDAYGEVL